MTAVSVDSRGYFEILTKKNGPQVLIASMIGFEKSSKKMNLDKPGLESIKFILREEAIAMPEATITASSFSSGDEKGVTLKRLEILTTPGAAADISSRTTNFSRFVYFGVMFTFR